jgi:hypothetical protein
MLPFAALLAKRCFRPTSWLTQPDPSKGLIVSVWPTDASGRGQTMVQVTTGEPEPEGCESKAEAAQTLGAARAPKQCRDERAGRGNVTEQITALLVAYAVGIPQSKPFAIREPRSGSCRGSRGGRCKCVVRKVDSPRYSAKTATTPMQYPRVRLSRVMSRRQTESPRNHREVSPGRTL